MGWLATTTGVLGGVGGSLAAPGVGTALGAGGGYALGNMLESMFGMGKKKSRDVPDPLAGLRAQLQALAAGVPEQVARQKELSAARYAEARKEGTQGIREHIRGEHGFGSSSIEDRLMTELIDKLTKSQSESELASDIWGTKQQADILSGTASMYPSQAELPEEENWQANLLGTGVNMAVQNWQNEQMWKNLANLLGKGGGDEDIILESLMPKPLRGSLGQPGIGSSYLNL